MAKVTPFINNFNGGEISPKIDARVDIDKYSSSCITLQNFIPMVEGGVTRMPGTKFVISTKTPAKKAVVIPFQFSKTQAYIIEVGEGYFRFYKDNAQITSGGNPVEVANSYTEDDLAQIKYTQSADVLYLFHPDFAPAKLSRTSHVDWVFTTITFRPPPTRELGHQPDTTLTPAATTGTGVFFTAGSSVFLTGDVGRIITSGAGRASITSFTSGTQVVCEILDDFADTDPIASGSWTLLYSPLGDISIDADSEGEICTVVSASSSEIYTDLLGFVTPYWEPSGSGTDEYYLINTAPGYTASKPAVVYIDGVQAVEGLVGSLGITQWDFADNDTLGYETIYVRLADGADPDTKSTAVSPDESFIQRTAGSDTQLFRSGDVGKYIYLNNGFVKITQYVSPTSVKGEIQQDLSSTETTSAWSMEEPMWTSANGYPSCGTFFEQRLVLSGVTNFPQTINLSVSGDYENFARDPDADDAAIEYTIASNGVDAVNWALNADALFLGTNGGVWRFTATNSDEPFSQTNLSPRKQDNKGTKDIAPGIFAGAVYWVDISGKKLYNLDYSLEKDRYIPLNMNRLASHIAFGDALSDSGFIQVGVQQEPVPIFWALRKDGQLCGMTLETQENVYGWFRVKMGVGVIESFAIIPTADAEDQIWVVVNRTIDGSTRRDIEYFSSMELYSEIKNSFFVHGGVTFDGGDSVTITGITNDNPAVVSAVNTFSGGEKILIEDVQGMTEANTGRLKAWTVANPTGTTFELSGIDSTNWGTYTSGGTAQVVQKDFTSGLDHLEGETVDVVIDGAVHPQKTVTNGGVSLNWYGNLVHIGLPIETVLEPTKPSVQTNQGFSRGKKQRINKALISFFETYGGKVGPDTDNLQNIKFGTGGTPALFTGLKEHPFPGSWDRNSSFVIKQELPLPMTVRSIVYELSVNED